MNQGICSDRQSYGKPGRIGGGRIGGALGPVLGALGVFWSANPTLKIRLVENDAGACWVHTVFIEEGRASKEHIEGASGPTPSSLP